MKNKTAISPVVAIALILVLAVVSVTSFQSWYSTYQTDLFTELEIQSNSATSSQIKLDSLIENTLYVLNNKQENLSILSLKIDNNDCNLTKNLSLGINEINISSCLINLTTQTPDVVLVTSSSVLEKQFYLREIENTISLSIIDPYPEVYTDTFISVWNTSEAGSSGANQIILPLENGGTYNFTISSPDLIDSPINVTSYTQDTFTFNNPGIHEVNITGKIIGFNFPWTSDKLKLYDIKAWGPLQVGNASSYFYGCANLVGTFNDTLNLTNTTILSRMFRTSTKFKGNISSWDVSQVTKMDYMFFDNINFDSNLSSWDVSQVTDMEFMFYNAASFTTDLSGWDVSQVKSTKAMFYNAVNFTSDLSSWDVSQVKTIYGMFYNADNFNSDIGGWDVSQVTDMSNVFRDNEFFNQDLSSWNVSNVTTITSMFTNANAFTSDLSSWDVKNVQGMMSMFEGATNFDSDLSSWNVSKSTLMASMFNGASSFNGNISSWDVSNVGGMASMFNGASNFNQDLSSWNVSKVTTCSNIFVGATAWEVSNKMDFNSSCTP